MCILTPLSISKSIISNPSFTVLQNLSNVVTTKVSPSFRDSITLLKTFLSLTLLLLSSYTIAFGYLFVIRPNCCSNEFPSNCLRVDTLAYPITLLLMTLLILLSKVI